MSTVTVQEAIDVDKDHREEMYHVVHLSDPHTALCGFKVKGPIERGFALKDIECVVCAEILKGRMHQ